MLHATFAMCLSIVPAEHWQDVWPSEKTVVIRMASKGLRQVLDTLRLPLSATSNWHDLFEHRNNLPPKEHCQLAFAQLRLLSNVTLVTTLSLIDCSLQGCSLQPLAEVLPHCPGLEHLDISWNAIEDEGLQMLAPSIAGCTRIKKLVLAANFLGDDGAETLAPILARLPQLEVLDVSRNGLTGTGLASIAEALPHCPKISTLLLSHNITANDVDSLTSVIPLLQNLVVLDLSYTDLGTTGLMLMFCAMPHMRRFHLATTGNPDVQSLTENMHFFSADHVVVSVN